VKRLLVKKKLRRVARAGGNKVTQYPAKKPKKKKKNVGQLTLKIVKITKKTGLKSSVAK